MPDSWKHLKIREKVVLRVPPDMRSIEPFGDHLLHVEAYGNNNLSIMVFTELLVPEAMSESQKQQLYSCERAQSVLEHPSYRESTVEIDGKQATIGISRSAPDRIVTDICFPFADNVKVPLRIVAFCSDDRAVDTAHQIFRSVSFID